MEVLKMKKDKYDDIWTALTKVIKDNTATDKDKLERIETYLEVYADINTPSFRDME
jgi:hypothetical protein